MLQLNDPWITYHAAPEYEDRGTEDDLTQRQKQLRPNANLVAARQRPIRGNARPRMADARYKR